MNGTGNKRRRDRKNLIYFPTVFEAGSDAEFGKIIDITTGGFMIVRATPLVEGSSHRLRIIWSNENSREESFECSVNICWCKPDVNPELFALGCKIQDATPAVVQNIARMITRWSFPEW